MEDNIPTTNTPGEKDINDQINCHTIKKFENNQDFSPKIMEILGMEMDF